MGVAEDETAGGPVIPGASWAIYLLQCSDGTYYTGSTAGDVNARVSVHNTGKGSKYVRSRLPAILAYTETNYTRSEALRRESKIKRLSRQAKQALCANQSSFAYNVNATHKHGEVMASELNEAYKHNWPPRY